MTIVSNPQTDSPDFSRGVGLGNGVLFFAVGFTVPAGGMTLGPWYVGIGSSTFIDHQCNFGPCAVETIWSYDSAGANIVEQGIYNRSLTNVELFDSVANVAPYLSILLSNGTGVPQLASMYVAVLGASTALNNLGAFGTNTGRVLAAMGAQAVNAGVTVTTSPGTTIPGPATLYLRSSGNLGDAQIQIQVGPFANDTIAGMTIPAGNNPAFASQAIAIPGDDWKLLVANRGAGAQIMAATVVSAR